MRAQDDFTPPCPLGAISILESYFHAFFDAVAVIAFSVSYRAGRSNCDRREGTDMQFTFSAYGRAALMSMKPVGGSTAACIVCEHRKSQADNGRKSIASVPHSNQRLSRKVSW
jgi:hypothetical protein